MNEVMAIAQQRGLKEVWVGTEDDNEPAKGLYVKLKPYEIEQAVIYSYKVNA